MLIIIIYFQGTYHTGTQDNTDHWEYEHELQIPVYTWGLQLCTSLYCILEKKKNALNHGYQKQACIKAFRVDFPLLGNSPNPLQRNKLQKQSTFFPTESRHWIGGLHQFMKLFLLCNYQVLKIYHNSLQRSSGQLLVSPRL